jgi:nucleoside recognition membrane protein YjiH
MKPEMRWMVCLLLAPVIGLFCFLAPILVAGSGAALEATTSMNLVSRVFENASPVPTTILLVLAGFGLRWAAGRGTWVLPVLLVAPFPAATAFDMVLNPASHNLLPFEAAFQLAFVVPGLVGAFTASVIARRTDQGAAVP